MSSASFKFLFDRFRYNPQFGKVMTKEQYKAIFGEEPLDLSYIRGATNNPFAVIASPDGSIIEVH